MRVISSYENVKKYKVEEVLTFICQKKTFAGYIDDTSFFLRIDEYLPIVCAAIHNGHQLRKGLKQNCLLSDEERFYEEDPYTDELISTFPITFVGNDSRFEYDLNRPLTRSTYFSSAWDKKVWSKPLSEKQRQSSHAKHKAFYLVLETLVEKLEELHKSCVIFDIHSYNYLRHNCDTPVFNIGTVQIDTERWSDDINFYKEQLERIKLSNIDNRVGVNELFSGQGYLISHINARFDNTLVFPTEVKKVFMNEAAGELYPVVLQELQIGMLEALTQTSANFVKKYSKKISRKTDMMTSSLDSNVVMVDKLLCQEYQDIETMSYINPLNIQSEKKRFFENPKCYSPEFKYKQINFNPIKIRANLFAIPFENIEDAGLQQFYIQVMEDINCRVDLLNSIGSQNFILNSQKHFGKPSRSLLNLAKYILAQENVENGSKELSYVSAEEAYEKLKHFSKKLQVKCKIELSKNILAKVIINHKKKSIILNANHNYSQYEVESFGSHHLGIHMYVSLFSQKQTLRVLSQGLPGYNETQEGLAVYSEYCYGALTLERLKTLAMRVLAVQKMLTGNSFYEIYQYFMDMHHCSQDAAYTIVARVFRGGGLTKDFQYLNGFKEVLKYSEKNKLGSLLAGKVSLSSLSMIDEMISRGLIHKPKPMVSLIPLDVKRNLDIDEIVNQIVLED